MKATKEELYGYTGSSIFCLLIFLVLYLNVIKAVIKAEQEGIMVNFGKIDLPSGTFALREESQAGSAGKEMDQQSAPMAEPVQQSDSKPTPVKLSVPKLKTTQQPVPKTSPVVKKNTSSLITQNLERTAAIEANKIKQEEKKRLEAEQRAQQAKEREEQQKREAINQQISGAFGSGANSQNQREATASLSFGQGQGQGQGGSGNSSAGSGYGEFNLGGRTLGAGGLPRPAYSVPEEGRIVINITVSPAGNVIFAEIGRGTNIDNANLRSSALAAARKAKFNNINGNNNQSGTITYRYLLK